ncbi:hypothetical protein C0J52_19806 [Blattella germanica]|nr:hypothetical protein C0J52_19806 [Blattella germanica]
MAEWLFFQSEVSPLENLFNQQYISIDVEFIVAQWHSGGIVKLKEVYHIEPNSPLQIVTVGSWDPQYGLHWKTPGFYKRRINLNKLVLRVAVSENDLPTKLFRDKTGKITGVGGFLGKIWTELESRLNFSSRYYESIEDERGIKMKDGSWVGMIGYIDRKEVDVAIGALTMYPSCLNVTDFLIPLLDDNTNMYIRELETLELHWSSFLSPFKRRLWLSVIAALILLTGALIFSLHMGKSSTQTFNFQNVLESFYCIYGAFCGQGRESIPKSWPSRIVFLTSFLIGYVLVAAYSAALVSFLTVQRSELPFTSFRGLLQDGTYKLGVTVGAEISYFSVSIFISLIHFNILDITFVCRAG